MSAECIGAEQLTGEDLRLAIQQNLIEPVFQPLVDLAADTTIGYEVLARWTDSRLGEISPTVFIAIAEAHGLIRALAEQVITKACLQSKLFDSQTFLAFNVSPVQLRDAGLFDEISSTIARCGFPFHRAHIEITESVLIEDQELALDSIRQFKSAGFGIALDDFGTGFSSLTRLHALPFDKLKIDASFVKTMDVDAGSHKIVAAVIGLGQSLGMAVVAEGIETAEQLRILKRMGCDIGQGYFLGKPMPSAQIAHPTRYRPGSFSSRRKVISPLLKLHQLETLYQGAPIALAFLDIEGCYMSVNDRYATAIGQHRADLLDRNIAETLDFAGRKTVASIMTRVLSGRNIVQKELKCRTNGRAHSLSCSRVVDDCGVPLGVSLSLMDITERRNTQDILRADEEHFRFAVELNLIPHVIWAATPDGVVNYISPTLAAGSGVALKDRIEDWYERMHPEDRPRVRQQWLAAIPLKGPFATEFRILWTDGQWRWVESHAVPSFMAGTETVARWLGVMTDVTDNRNLRDKLEKLEGEIGVVPNAILQLFRS